MWRGGFLMLIAVMCFGSSSALARQARRSKDPLHDAKRLYSRLRYEEAVPKLKHALDGDLPPDKRLEALALLGTIEIILDEPKAARGHFTELLRQNRGYRLDPGLSPKIIDFFAELRLQLYPPQSARFMAPPQIEIPAFGGTEVAVPVTSSNGPIQVFFLHREIQPDSPSPVTFHRVKLHTVDENRYAATLPLTRPQQNQAPIEVEYYAEIIGQEGQVLDACGGPTDPRRFELRAPPAYASAASEPLLWAGVGAGALLLSSVVVVSAIVLNQPDPPPDSSLGAYTLGR